MFCRIRLLCGSLGTAEGFSRLETDERLQKNPLQRTLRFLLEVHINREKKGKLTLLKQMQNLEIFYVL